MDGAQAQHVSVLFIGDSLSDFDRGSNHVDRLQSALDAAWPGKVEIHNYAVRGDYIDRVLDRLDGKPGTYGLERYDGIWDRAYGWAFVSLGHNDTRAWDRDGFATPEIAPERTREGYRDLIARLKDKGISRIVLYSATSSNFDLTRPKAEKKVADIRAGKSKPKRVALFGTPAFLEAHNAVLKDLADTTEGVEYLDLYTDMKAHPRKASLLRASDGVHLTQEGHAWVAAREFDYLAKRAGLVTLGWENVNPNRHEFPLSEVVWSAPTNGLTVEMLDGAEGDVSFDGGRIAIRKTNDTGTIRVSAPTARFDAGRHARFSADILECRTKSADKALGGLSVSTNGAAFPERDEFAPARWFQNGGPYMRRMVCTAPGMSYRKYTHGVSADGAMTPAIYVKGAASESVWGNWRAEYNDEAQALWRKFLDERRVPDRAPKMEDDATFEAALAADIDHTAEIRTVDARSVLFVDGRPTPPILYRESHMFFPPTNYLTYAGHPLHDAGVKVGVIELCFATNPARNPGFWTKDGFDLAGAVDRIRRTMRVAGPQVFLLALNLNPYPEFSAEHPDEVWIREDGSVARGTFGSVSADYDSGGNYGTAKKTWPWVSYASPAYRKAVMANLTALVEELKRAGIAKRIVGFHLSGFHDGQFAMPFPDYSPCVKAEYGRSLAEGHQEPEFDYFSLQTGFRTQEAFARHLRREIGKPVVVARWCMTPFGGGAGAHDIAAFARSDAIDVIVPQTAYAQRQPALATSCNLPCATFHDRGKMMWYEFDHRNWAAYDTWAKSVIAVKGLGSAEDLAQWTTIDRKHHGMTIALGMGNWYYDMGGAWLRPSGVVEEVADVCRFREDLLRKKPDPWRPDVVWVIDERAICLYNRKGQPAVEGGVRAMVAGARGKLGASGVPFEVRLVDDFLENPDLVKRYRAALLAGFLFPDESRKALMARFAEAGVRTLVERADGIEAEEFNAFAREAGAFVAADPGTEVDMNGDFMSLHALSPGRRRISLPFPARVVNVRSGLEESAGPDGFDVAMSAGETCWFRLFRIGPEPEPESASSDPAADAAKRIWDFTAGLPNGGRLQAGAARDGGLVAGRGGDTSDRGGFVLNAPFTPLGAFLFEAEFVPDAPDESEYPARGEGILWDDMCVVSGAKRTNRGMQLQFHVLRDVWKPTLHVGFGDATAHIAGPEVSLPGGRQAKISFLYGADGTVTWNFNGVEKQVAVGRVADIAQAEGQCPVIGNRGTSLYHPFAGRILRVAIEGHPMNPFAAKIVGRAAFVRGEKDATLEIAVANISGEAVEGAEAVLEPGENGAPRPAPVAAATHPLGTIPAGGEARFSVPVETRLSLGWRTLRLVTRGRKPGGEAVETARTLRVGIGPAPPSRLPALMWYADAAPETIASYGFTHLLKNFRFHAGPLPDVEIAEVIGFLDEALVAGIHVLASFPFMTPPDAPEDVFHRHSRSGEDRTHGAKRRPCYEASNPEAVRYGREMASAYAKALAGHPAFSGVLPCSELRDQSYPSFPHEAARYRAETGREVPIEIDWRNRFDVKEAEKRFPDGLVPEDDPVLSYYRWFWSGGDGWPDYIGAVAEEFRARAARDGFFAFWDPAARCPPIWGSGGSVEMLDQWVYANPEPMNVGGPVEELFAMAAGRPGQKVGIMTQLICYREQLAPKATSLETPPAWALGRSDAEFPTIPPDSLQEATWSMLAKPVQAVMYHGWQTVCETGSTRGYAYTCPESEMRLKALLRDVVEPLGAMLPKLGRKPPRVAVFESFANTAMGGPASWGWKAPALTYLQRARLDPRVVYEETILRDGLDGVRVLHAPQARFLTPRIVDAIRDWQAKGGLLLADAECVKALTPDIAVPVVSFDPPPESDHTEEVNVLEAAGVGANEARVATERAKSVMVAQARDLRRRLEGRYTPPVDSDSAEIVVYSRHWKDVGYVFAVNDRRTFGDYVGAWGKTMEKGLPQAGTVSVEDAAGAVNAVYELSRGGEVAFSRERGRCVVPVDFETNDGRLFAFLPQRIARVESSAPECVGRGEVFEVALRVLDETDALVDALLPVEIRLFDAKGREIDGGWMAAEGGVCTARLSTNLDDPDGEYLIECRDRASGFSVSRTLR